MGLSSLGAKIRAHKLISIIVLVCLIGGLCYGGWYGWQEYQRRQTSAFAVEKLKQALSAADTNTIAHMVDFNSVGRDMAQAGKKAFPFYMAGEDQERGISRVLQTALLKRFMEPEQKGSMFPEDQSEQAKLQKPLELMPPDFVAQLVSSLQSRETDAGSALVSAKVEQPQLGQTFTLVLAMQKTPQGWQIRRLVNADELASQLNKAMLARHAALRNVFEEKNSLTSKQMNQIIPVQSCTADAGVLSDGKTALLVINAIARNRGDVQVNNFNLDTTITGRSGNVLVHRFLNAAKPVAPGEDFNHRWSMELESSSPLVQALLHDGPLHCQAAWQTLGLNNGKVLHVVEVPNPDIDCDRPGHDHPMGFCMLPVFQH